MSKSLVWKPSTPEEEEAAEALAFSAELPAPRPTFGLVLWSLSAAAALVAPTVAAVLLVAAGLSLPLFVVGALAAFAVMEAAARRRRTSQLANYFAGLEPLPYEGFEMVHDFISSLAARFGLPEVQVVVADLGECRLGEKTAPAAAFALSAGRKRIVVFDRDLIVTLIDRPDTTRYVIAHEVAHLMHRDSQRARDLRRLAVCSPALLLAAVALVMLAFPTAAPLATLPAWLAFGFLISAHPRDGAPTWGPLATLDRRLRDHIEKGADRAALAILGPDTAKKLAVTALEVAAGDPDTTRRNAAGDPTVGYLSPAEILAFATGRPEWGDVDHQWWRAFASFLAEGWESLAESESTSAVPSAEGLPALAEAETA